MDLPITRSANTDYLYNYLTGTGSNSFSKDYGLPPLSHNAAAGMMGSMAVETGKWDLMNLDVVETKARAGRGAWQYTDGSSGAGRRAYYDAQRAQAIKNGVDPNSMAWQLQHMRNEYKGKGDYVAGGKSLVGWSRALETYAAKTFSSPGEAAVAFTGSAASRQGYLRPGVPHHDKRAQAAMQFSQLYKGREALGNLRQIPSATNVPNRPSSGILKGLDVNLGMPAVPLNIPTIK